MRKLFLTATLLAFSVPMGFAASEECCCEDCACECCAEGCCCEEGTCACETCECCATEQVSVVVQ